MKKFLSIALTLAMVMALSVPALAEAPTPATGTAAAEDEGIYGASVAVDGSIVTPTISITVSTGAKVVANPYKLLVNDLSGTALEENTVTQIISGKYGISSVSNVAVDVTVITSAKLGGDVELAAAASEITATTTDKLAFLFMEIDDEATFADGEWGGSYDGAYADGDIVITEKAAKVGTKVATLAAVEGTYNTDTNAWAAGNDEDASEIGFTISGAMAEKPETPWTGEDTIDVTLAFTFTPSTGTAAAGG